ncbi:probable mediator of RNA polymerase II transcription subunit 26a [Diospyros lotus]|uniref:probable mediator of RNA polymerase II transcription subunit 26a n=1 Tax=Diospyros lotus TaxID=55363 RepID=UPI00225B49EC|nr:probable mediator of RNA polymerase II transcription subunit 26a [Diospyros lotus]
MSGNSGTLDEWRNYFRRSNFDIFDVIQYAIMVAASDSPQEFISRRDQIAQTLFSCKFVQCKGCDSVELGVAHGDEEGGCKSTGFHKDACGINENQIMNGRGDEQLEMNLNQREKEKCCKSSGFHRGACGINENKIMNRSRNEQLEMNSNQLGIDNHDADELLAKEIEGELLTVDEVLRIKQILDNSQDQSNSELFASLRKLQLMHLSVDILKATDIGKSVKALTEHGAKNISELAGQMIVLWKDMMDEWFDSIKMVIADSKVAPESDKPIAPYEDEGLPVPPLEEEAFFTFQTAPVDLSNFFDGMDEVEKIHNFNKDFVADLLDRKEEETHKQEIIMNKMAVNGGNDTIFQEKSDAAEIQKKPLQAARQDKLKCLDESGKLEIARRTVRAGYKQNAMRRRSIQVVDARDLPKQELGHARGNTDIKLKKRQRPSTNH